MRELFVNKEGKLITEDATLLISSGRIANKVRTGNEIDRYGHPIYIGCVRIYLTSMLLAERGNRYER